MELYSNLSNLQRNSNNMWAQRARLSWIKDGDKNTTFFHAITCIRAQTNCIAQVVNAQGILCRDHASIESAFLTFYKNLWTSPICPFVNPLDALPCDLPRLSDSDAALLVREVTKEKVYHTILDLPTGKAPGPDGVTVEFYRKFWPLIGHHLYSAIRFFFDNSFIPSSWGKTFVTLIPKIEKPKLVSDFKPISLCNVNFKIISKILANRLRLVLPLLIGREQAGFVSDRCSFDNIIAVQEIVHSMENDTKNPPRMLIKLDIEKAYDTVNWSAILVF